MSSCRMVIDSVMLVPTMRVRAAADSVPPYSCANALSPTSHNFSLSTSVPSMSNRTPAKLRPLSVLSPILAAGSTVRAPGPDAWRRTRP